MSSNPQSTTAKKEAANKGPAAWETQGGKPRVSRYGLSRREDQFFSFKMVTEDRAIPSSLQDPHRHATLTPFLPQVWDTVQYHYGGDNPRGSPELCKSKYSVCI